MGGFDKVIGCESIKLELRQIVDMLKNTKMLDQVVEELMQKQHLLFSDIQRIKSECGLVETSKHRPV